MRDLISFTLRVDLLSKSWQLAGTHKFSAHVGGTDLNAGVTLHTECAGEEIVELSLENSVSNELFLGVDLLYLIVCHLLVTLLDVETKCSFKQILNIS
jgi:hypothetical protein